MRKVYTSFAESLDGFIEGPKGEIDWIVQDQAHYKFLQELWESTDTMLYGRKSYEVVVAAVRQSKSLMNPFKHMKHLVFSSSLGFVEEGFVLIREDAGRMVEKLKNEPGKDIAVFGGASLACSLINRGLIDEIIVALSPILLGDGKRFFEGITGRYKFKLKNAISYSSGLVVLTYTRSVAAA
ncbi:MAG TPA: dihydrofolate reductase family protein [Puia sp.]|nr:dihydrofolate reductase family protein [Puia sp.]